ncbi:hypothetical protein ACP70R_011424 [Stipagrostis hirtigluma subsp. patula]
MANVDPPPMPTYKQVVDIGLIPQDHEAILRDARRREFLRAEARGVEFLRERRRRRASRRARQETEADLYVQAAYILASAKMCPKGCGNPYSSIRSVVRALKNGSYGSESGDMLGVSWF